MKSYSVSYLQWRFNDPISVSEAKMLEALASHPEDAIAIHHQLAILFLPKDDDESIEKLSLSAGYLIDHGEDGEDRSKGYELLAISHEYSKQDDDMAIHYYTLSLQEDATNESSLDRLGGVYQRHRKYKEALSCYEKLEELDPGNSLVDIGECYIGLKDYETAEKFLNAALANRTSVSLYNAFGRCASERGDEEQAKVYFHQALELNPDDANTNFYLGISYQHTEDYYRALHYYSKAVALYPEFSGAYHNMALCYDSLGDDTDAAIAHFEKALGTAATSNMRITLYLTLSQFHNKRLNFKEHELYKKKLLQEMGFPVDEDDFDENEDDMEDEEQ